MDNNTRVCTQCGSPRPLVDFLMSQSSEHIKRYYSICRRCRSGVSGDDIDSGGMLKESLNKEATNRANDLILEDKENILQEEKPDKEREGLIEDKEVKEGDGLVERKTGEKNVEGRQQEKSKLVKRSLFSNIEKQSAIFLAQADNVSVPVAASEVVAQQEKSVEGKGAEKADQTEQHVAKDVVNTGLFNKVVHTETVGAAKTGANMNIATVAAAELFFSRQGKEQASAEMAVKNKAEPPTKTQQEDKVAPMAPKISR
jgi:hypothetical protein